VQPLPLANTCGYVPGPLSLPVTHPVRMIRHLVPSGARFLSCWPMYLALETLSSFAESCEGENHCGAFPPPCIKLCLSSHMYLGIPKRKCPIPE